MKKVAHEGGVQDGSKRGQTRTRSTGRKGQAKRQVFANPKSAGSGSKTSVSLILIAVPGEVAEFPLPAPGRGFGCFVRRTEAIEVCGVHMQVIVSSCKLARWKAESATKGEELFALGLGGDELRGALQSWIDGYSPCDFRFALREDVQYGTTESSF